MKESAAGFSFKPLTLLHGYVLAQSRKVDLQFLQCHPIQLTTIR